MRNSGISTRHRLWHRLFIGLACLLGLATMAIGIFIGGSSRHVNYEFTEKTSITRYLSTTTGTMYLQLDSTPTIFLVQSHLFSPTIDFSRLTHLGYKKAGILYDVSEKLTIAVQGENGVELNGTGYRVIALTFFNDIGSQQGFLTNEYKFNRNDYTLNYWPVGSLCILAGLLLVLAGFIYGIRLQKPEGALVL